MVKGGLNILVGFKFGTFDSENLIVREYIMNVVNYQLLNIMESNVWIKTIDCSELGSTVFQSKTKLFTDLQTLISLTDMLFEIVLIGSE